MARAEESYRRKAEKARAREEREKKAAAKRKASDARHSRKGAEMLERESAMSYYQGWSLSELRSEAKDFGISDYNRNWKSMSKEQLALWLYRHGRSAHRTYYR